MSEDRWKLIAPHLNGFQQHLAAHIPVLRIENATDRLLSDERYRQQCKTGIFNQQGVYLIFDDREALQYVGVAMNTFHHRIWTHDAHMERRFIDVIPFPNEFCFLALALEYFLICRLRPPKNAIYQGHEISTGQPKAIVPDAEF
jgi:hypothetical protein